MFATLRYDTATHVVEIPERKAARAACSNCRARKLRCSGEKEGCDRCKSKSVPCTYPAPTQRTGPKKSKQSQGNTRPRSDGSTSSSGPSSSSPSVSSAPTTAGSTPPSTDGGTAASSNPPTEDTPPMASFSWATESMAFPGMDDGPAFMEDPHNLNMEIGNALDPFDEDFNFDGMASFDLDLLQTARSSETRNKACSSSATSDNLEMEDAFHSGIGAADVSQSAGSDCHSFIFPPTTSGPDSSAQTAESTTFSLAGAGSSSCQCLTSASCLLEVLSVEQAQVSLRTVARMLQVKKRVMSRCDILVECPFCSSLSHFVLLLVFLCQKMGSSYEQMLAILTEQYTRLQVRRDSSDEFMHGVEHSHEAADDHQVTIKDYDLDVDEEPCVLGALTLVQIRKLQGLVGRLKTVASSWKWEPHIAILESTDEQAKRLLRLYDKATGPAVQAALAYARRKKSLI